MENTQSPQLGDTLEDLDAVCLDVLIERVDTLQEDGSNATGINRPVLIDELVERIGQVVVDQLQDGPVICCAQILMPSLGFLDRAAKRSGQNGKARRGSCLVSGAGTTYWVFNAAMVRILSWTSSGFIWAMMDNAQVNAFKLSLGSSMSLEEK